MIVTASGRGGTVDGQPDCNRRAPAGLARQVHGPSAQFDFPLRIGQPEARSGGLRREVRLERAAHIRLVHAHAGVGHANLDAVAGRRGVNRQAAAVGHGLNRVFHQVGERAGEQRDVAPDRRQRRRGVHHNLHVGRQRGLIGLHDACDERGHADRFEPRRARPRRWRTPRRSAAATAPASVLVVRH